MNAIRAVWLVSGLAAIGSPPVHAGEFCPDLATVLARAPDFKAIGAGPVPGVSGLTRTGLVLNGFQTCEIASPESGLWLKHGREYRCASVAMEEAQARAWGEAMGEAVRGCLPRDFEEAPMPDFAVSRNGGETRENRRCAKRPDRLTVCAMLRHTFTNAMAMLSGRPRSDEWRVWLTVSKSQE